MKREWRGNREKTGGNDDGSLQAGLMAMIPIDSH
jgi:hypothetical protein